MGLTIKQTATRVLRFEHDRIGLQPPHLRPDHYATIVRDALALHELPAFADPECLLAAEGFRLSWAPVPGCGGAQLGDLVLLAWRADPRLRALLVHHERAHAWLRRRHWREATEADAWLLTGAFVAAAMEHWGVERAATFPWAPDWFLVLVVGAEMD